MDHGPYRSGTSRHPLPVRNRHNTPFNCCRILPGNGPVAATGRNGSINAHSPLVTSKRATTEFYQATTPPSSPHKDPNPAQLLARATRLRLWSEHLERSESQIDGDPARVIDGLWRPIAEEQARRRAGGEPRTHRLTLLPNVSRHAERLQGPLRGLLVDG